MSSSDLSPTEPGPPAADDSARVELSSRIASLELSLVASDFRTLASGMGRLSATVPAGIYQVVVRAGPIVDRKLISLDPASVYRDDDVALSFPAAAPVEKTSTSHEYHQHFAERASQAVNQASGPDSGLVIVVRDVLGTDGPPLEPGDVACFGLIDERLLPVAGFEQGWEVQGKEAVATWSGRLPPGGYALRTDPSRSGTGPRRPTTDQPYDQSLWLSQGWQTILFITTGAGGPRSSAASVHMTHMGISWSPYEVDVGLALELANWGLREGRSVLPDDLLSVLLGTKFVNPMLGIVGAHSLLLGRQPDARLLDVVLNNLENMVPGHPDVQALRWIAASRLPGAEEDSTAGDSGAAAGATGTPSGGASWPPMLLPSYRALIAMDADHPSAIADGSPAERAAANLLVQGIWTSWTPLPAVALMTPARPRLRGRGARPMAAAGVLPALAREPSLMEKVPLSDPATARVAGYLGALAALEGPSGRLQRFATLTPQEIGLATTLPAATVNRALAGIAASMTPAGGGGGGSPGGRGLIRGSLPFLAAGALLLAGVVGAVAWCAGNEACPVPMGVSESTATPTVDQTPEATRSRPRPTPTALAPASPTPDATPLLIEHPSELDFGPVTIGGETGPQPLTVLAPEPVPFRFEFIENPDDAFAVGDDCQWTETGSELLGCTVVVTFDPARDGAHLGALGLLVADEQEPRPIALVGEGVAPFLRYPDRLEFGTVTIGFPVEKNLVVFGTEPVSIEFDVIDGDAGAFSPDPSCAWMERQPGLFECTIGVTFGPQKPGEHLATLGIFSGEPEPRTIELIGNGENQFL